MAKIEFVIFDFDGTLVDTAPDLVRAVNFYLQSQGVDVLPEAQIRAEIGMGLRKLILDVYPELHAGDEQQKRRIETGFIKVYEREFLNDPQLFHGAREFLTEWDKQFAIVSNKKTQFIHPILKKLDIHTLPWVSIIGGDSYTNMKPHPEPFLAAMKAAGVTPEETLIVGDGAPDVEGAIRIGAPCAAAEWGYTPVEQLMSLGATTSVESFEHLLPLIRALV